MSAIVLGYDSSPGSRAALEAATQLAGGLAAKLVIVYGYGAPGSNLSGDEIAAHRTALADEGKSLTGDAQRHAQDAGVESEVELVDERPTDALLEVAAKHSAAYIVVGGYGESPLRGAILGSTPHKLLHLSETPVVVVPAAGG